ncbi:MAG: hypothetical protein A3G52_04850 [Candidatus Taylorbacteria bacterium RIFCSPLOWO2_12_FULL_43_20]|uniref:Carbohydrate kinase PfkB domain-containing protein n=1 Tax=Candidatus Taylorbacteria bacterium RIFCSPLOWO2_12_FULL_43_20 TaxID=1802332 RepID=A0A1G2P2K8_9BACT|nr:MAG: hypothetical protein A3B98_00110 [Candidatus Taylorbacteria bacterium RIFCSPHIGHO2_02_FULL_43_55]OHA29684.1 MAG: hypothetical protein A3E92_03700 [Candidatus Taylorbacteria bacterium RIFCSPHIGHO2_12_FULL_42_34]OHA31008.1 MAG: hypothetical protein A3B09_01295 [Candidatus Taylorbacteria bacterium RIFCSPLOWO2_01_FULL_43_83]OHA38992.1 MAG: hypothetical protein A3H58_00930 [Candidatus Taylorbacteria bacterium RIFCSPLOWO2_02_FULL_43_22b]OHA42503.1 MAG: hypothetical protein A3G52_04850 [Candid
MNIMKTKHKVVVGFSVNPEFEINVGGDAKEPKKTLRRFSGRLSGSSGNVAIALQTLGVSPRLLGLVGVSPVHENSWEGKFFDELVRSSGFSFWGIPALQRTNIAAIPVVNEKNGEVWGRRNGVLRHAIRPALRMLESFGSNKQAFAVVTSLRGGELPFATSLLAATQEGYRVLNAKDTLCRRPGFVRLLRIVDVVVLNRQEFAATNMSYDAIHRRGPKIVVVTHDKDGGYCSFCGKIFSFAPHSFKGGVFETGAGDWFLGALVAELIRHEENAASCSMNQFRDIIDFSAKVAGKKITMSGGSNGPTRVQLRQPA